MVTLGAKTFSEWMDERFWPRVKKTETCWLWTGDTMSNGYGTVLHFGKERGAHRISLAYRDGLFVGNIHKNIYCCHKCDTPTCVNPNHLFWGTPSDNTQDAIKKKKFDWQYEGWTHHMKGKPNHSAARHSPADVRMMITAFKMGMQYTEVFKAFGMKSNSALTAIMNGKTWNHGEFKELREAKVWTRGED
jgi:hypothetical protein